MGKFLRFNNGKYKIYLASLKNSDLNLLKIGITQFVDADSVLAVAVKSGEGFDVI